jgi:chromatin remodeling complex protein RSC6
LLHQNFWSIWQQKREGDDGEEEEKRMMMMENSEWEENLERGIRKRTGEGNGDANDALISHLVPVEYVRCRQ